MENSRIDINIKWADAYILIYAVTDRCSFNECSRLKILINSYSRHQRSKGQNSTTSTPIVLVGNMTDKGQDRMVSTAEGREKAYEMSCLGFYEISLREERDSAAEIISDLYIRCRRPSRRPDLQQRLSCPPSFQSSPMTVGETGDDGDGNNGQIPRQRRRRKALYTISWSMDWKGKCCLLFTIEFLLAFRWDLSRWVHQRRTISYQVLLWLP